MHTTAILAQFTPKQPQQQQQPFNSCLSGTTRVGRYQKKHSPAHTHPGKKNLLKIQKSKKIQKFQVL